MSDDRNLFTIFCDDVRQEAGGKLSYMGIYGPELIVPSFPTTLPKFCFVITARSPATAPFQKLSFRLMKDDEVIAQTEMTNAMQDALARMRSGEADEVISIVGIMQIFPLTLPGPCTLRVRADTERGELRGGTLTIVSGTSSTQHA